MTPDLRQLRYFLVLAEELNFTAAASRLYVTQQTLSRAVAQLERDLGKPLFHRTTRAVELTSAGEAMVEPARRVMAAVADAVTAARGHAGDSDMLRIDISSAGIRTGAEILRELTLAPGAPAVHQVEVGVRTALDMIRDGMLDAALGQAPNRATGIHSEAVRDEPLLVGVSNDHEWAKRTSVTARELGTQPLLLPSTESAAEWREHIERLCHSVGMPAVAWRNITHGSVAAANEVRNGMCVVPTNEWTEPPPDLRFLPVVNPVPRFTWSLMWSAGRGDQIPISTLRSAARAAAQRLEWATGSAPA
jgi:DNA-binding transcriptional LysR family regulator